MKSRENKLRLPVAMSEPSLETSNGMYRYDLGYKQFKLQVVLYAPKISICPYIRAYNIMGLIIFLLANNFNKLLGIDEIFLAITNELLSIHLQFAMLTMFEEATFDILMTGLATAELYHVRLDPARLDPNITLVRIPDSLIAVEHSNTDNIIQALWEDCPVGYK